jgi:glycosyltransferase involved in cell wall biosynthesis
MSEPAPPSSAQNHATPPVAVGGGGADFPLLDVAIWLDPQMLQREAAFLRHLVVALKSDGHNVRFISPADLDLSALPVLGSSLETYAWHRWEQLAPLRRLRLARIIETLREDPPDLLLVWGSAEPLGPQIVLSATNLPALLWCWDASELFTPLADIPQVRQIVLSAEPLRERLPTNCRVPVNVIHPGVYTDDAVACYDVPGQVPCIVSLDPLADIAAFQNLIKACRYLTDDGLDFMLFTYDQGAQEHPIWQLAQKIDILDRIGFVPFQQDAEPLLLHGDLYLHVLPTSRVQYRTLEAMGRGLAIVTRPNHAADFLVDGQTCRIVAEPTAENWRVVLQELILDRAKAAGIARRGQQYVREHHAMSESIGQFITLCRRAAGTPLRLAPSV